ncbi:MAG: hypothetical protein JWN03_7355 [Nocardia sp.]|nr:hypothetical protein [Nocardia sp.]
MPTSTGSGALDILAAIAHLITSGSSTSIIQPPPVV